MGAENSLASRGWGWGWAGGAGHERGELYGDWMALDLEGSGAHVRLHQDLKVLALHSRTPRKPMSPSLALKLGYSYVSGNPWGKQGDGYMYLHTILATFCDSVIIWK